MTAISRSRLAALVLVIWAIGAIAWLALGIAPTSAQTSAQTATVQGTSLSNNWPDSVTVTALVNNGDELESATFLYTILPEGALTREAAEIQRGDVTRLHAEFETRNARLWIPAGADFEWRWELIDQSGERTETEPQVWRYEDPRFEWQSLKQGDLEIAWYHNEAVARTMLEEGLIALAEISPFLGLDELIPIKVYVWANNDDAREVERLQSETFEESVLTGGTRVLADLVHVYQPTRWVVRHELTHVLTKLAGEGPYGDLPAWLDEGMATIAEGDWLERRGPALQFAINSDQVLSLRSMESPSNRPGFIDIFYGQSAAVVQYLIVEYGSEAMSELFQRFKAGAPVDDALTAVYGLTRDELDNEWRVSVGLDPREATADRSTAIEDDVIGGPEVADEQSSQQASQQGAQQQSQPQQSDQQAAGESEGRDEQEQQQSAAQESVEQEAAEVSGRSEAEIEARTAEVQRRQEQRRPAPLFELAEPFPWEWPLMGIAAGLLLFSAVLLVRTLSPSR